MKSMMADDLYRVAIITAGFAISVWDDLRRKKISNTLVVSLFAVAAAYLFFRGGLGNLGTGLLSGLLAFTMTLPLYMGKVLGGGDIKVFTAASLLMNWQVVCVTLLAAFIWGSLLGLLRTLLSGQAKNLFHNLFAIVAFKAKVQEDRLHKIPFSIALIFGYLSSFVYLGVA